MKQRIRNYSKLKDTALIFPMAFKEHVDHFIVREAAIQVAKDQTIETNATFYFQEDKPYGGIATETEQERINAFISENKLHPKTYTYDPETVIDLAFKYYVSQVEEIYNTGVRERAHFLQKSMQAGLPCDRIYVYAGIN